VGLVRLRHVADRRLRFRGGLVFKAHRRLYHSTLGLRVIKKKKNKYRPPLDETETSLHVCRRTINLRRPDRARNEGVMALVQTLRKLLSCYSPGLAIARAVANRGGSVPDTPLDESTVVVNLLTKLTVDCGGAHHSHLPVSKLVKCDAPGFLFSFFITLKLRVE